MFGLDPGAAFLFVSYQFVMLYGVGSLAFRWEGGQHQSGREHLFFLLGFCIPLTVWLLSMFFPPTAWLMPVSLGALAVVGSRDRRRLMETGVRDLDADLTDAESQIAEDAGNAAAHLAKAETLEKRGEYARALGSYRLAHRICRRTVTDYDMEAAEERLAAAMEGAHRRAARPRIRGPMLAFELLMLAVSAVHHSLDPGNHAAGAQVFDDARISGDSGG